MVNQSWLKGEFMSSVTVLKQGKCYYRTYLSQYYILAKETEPPLIIPVPALRFAYKYSPSTVASSCPLRVTCSFKSVSHRFWIQCIGLPCQKVSSLPLGHFTHLCEFGLGFPAAEGWAKIDPLSHTLSTRNCVIIRGYVTFQTQ